MCNEKTYCCLRILRNWGIKHGSIFLKSLLSWKNWADIATIITAGSVLIAIHQWRASHEANQQTAYKELREQADAVEKEMRDHTFMQAFEVNVPGSLNAIGKLRMQLALLTITNIVPKEDWEAVFSTSQCGWTTNQIALASLMTNELGIAFFKINTISDLNDYLFGSDQVNLPGKIQMRTGFFIVEKYLDAFETGWQSAGDLIDQDDWKDWVSYLNVVATHPLFRCAAYRAKLHSGFTDKYLDFIRGHDDSKNRDLLNKLSILCPES